MNRNSRVYVAGHTGLIGSAVFRRLQKEDFRQVVVATHSELELTDGAAVDSFFERVQPEYVVLAAGRVGGIVENLTFPAECIIINLAMQLNVLRSAHRIGVKKLILFASSCMYPRECSQPMSENAIYTGKPEPTSLAYAITKQAGMQMCLAYNQQQGEKRFIPLIPNSAFGPQDNFDIESGHVLSALIKRFHDAKTSGIQSVTLWGSGTPRREFIHSDDIAEVCLFLLEEDISNLELPLNLGNGKDYSISELAEIVAGVVGFTGHIEWDTSKPDGAPRKLLDSERLLKFGWKPTVSFESGIRSTYQWYLENLVTRGGNS